MASDFGPNWNNHMSAYVQKWDTKDKSGIEIHHFFLFVEIFVGKKIKPVLAF